MDQPRDERSLYRHGCLLAAMLVIAAASRDFLIRRLESLHIDQATARKTVPGPLTDTQKDKATSSAKDHPSDGLGVNDPVGRRRAIKAFVSRCVCGLQCPLWVAGSTDRCNTFCELLSWGLIEQGLSGPFVELPCDCAELGLAMQGQISATRKILAQQSIGVFV
jgi:hypothetical protein